MEKTVLLTAIIFSIALISFSATNTINPTDNNIGVILGDVVNVRSAPNTRSTIIDTVVKEKEYIKLIKWTNEVRCTPLFEQQTAFTSYSGSNLTIF